MLKVAKFGGSSVASAEQFKKVKEIVKMDASRKFVVVSAIGKANKDDNKITDLLYLCYAHIKYNMNCDAVFNIIEKKFCDIAEELNLNFDIKGELLKEGKLFYNSVEQNIGSVDLETGEIRQSLKQRLYIDKDIFQNDSKEMKKIDIICRQ